MVFDGMLILVAIACFALFLAHTTALPAPVMPLAILSASVCWLFVWGVCGALQIGAWLWLALALAALAFVWLRGALRTAVARLNHIGLWLFFVASVGFWVLFAVRQPMFTQWDEFTFWGTAIKLTVTQDVLHSVAQGNLSARAYPPSMMLLAYLFQFLSVGFAEWKAFAAVNSFLIACVCAMSAAFREDVHIPAQRRASPLCARAGMLLTCGVVLLYFFSARAGTANVVYLSVMSDWVLGAAFGGALCVYFAAGNRRSGPVALGAVLVFLTLLKEIGLAYAMIVVGCVVVDRVFANAQARALWARLWRAARTALALMLPFLIAYLGWTQYVLHATGVDKAVVGNEDAGTVVGYGFVLVDGVLQLFGRGDAAYAAEFADLRAKMLGAFVNVDVCLLGGGVFALAVIGVVLCAAFYVAQRGVQRRRIAWFSIASAGAFVAFVVFHLFLYVYSFSNAEAAVLKDYERYIAPYYLGWLMVALYWLAALSVEGKKTRLARASLFGVCSAVVLLVGLRGIPNWGFWNQSNQQYVQRLDVQARVAPMNALLDWEDEVFIISQSDDGTRWYYYGYELNATVGYGYRGKGWAVEGAERWLTTASSLVPRGNDGASYRYFTECSAEDLVAFLRDRGYSHVLLDESDPYIYTEMAELFAQTPPETWESGVAILYEIVDDGTTMTFVPVVGGGV